MSTPTDIESLEAALAERYATFPNDPRRERAWEAFQVLGLPSKRQEDWRWSDLGDGLRPKTPASRVAAPGDEGEGHTLAPLNFEGLHIRLDGNTLTWPNTLPEGIKIIPSPGALPLAGIEETPMAAAATALAGGVGVASALMIEIAKPLTVPIIFTISGSAQAQQFGRIQGLIRPNASAEIIEIYETPSNFTSIAMDWDVQADATLSRRLILRTAKAAKVSAFCKIALGENSEFIQHMLSFGAAWSRLETDVSFIGRHAKATLNAVSLIGNAKHCDATTRVHHSAQSCQTVQKHKTAVRAGGKAIFQGKFIVPRTIGQFTNATMAHDALLLENGAAVFAKPELEIYADDVECAHGNTSGSLDENALFYARQRGIPESDARAMLTYAFVAEALSGAPDVFSDLAARWLGVAETWR